MRKVVIADDEQHICRLIDALIEWKAFGLEVVGFAHDGNTAFQMCMDFSPDFLITDIRMPGLGGLDLTKKLYDSFPEIKVIVITGYSHFSYAHQALRYNVIDYLLKPIQKEELEHALEKGLTLIDKEEVQMLDNKNLSFKSMQDIKDNLLSLILRGGSQRVKAHNIGCLFQEFHLKFMGNAWQLLQIEFILSSEENTLSVHDFLENKIKDIVVEELKHDKIEMITSSVDNSFFCLLNGDNDILELVDTVMNQVKNKLLVINDILQKINFTIGISNICEDINQIYDCVNECQNCINQKIVKGKNKIIRYDSIPIVESEASYFVDENFRKRFLKNIADGDGEAISAEINELATLLYRFSGKTDGNVVLEVYEMLVKMFFKGIQVFDFTDFKEFSQENLLQQKVYFYNISGAFAYLGDIFQLLLGRGKAEKENQNTRPIRLAQLYMEEHYMDSITLEEIAKHVGLNETYLSTIFKKQMGRSLIDFLTYTRVQRAKEMLINRGKSINEISEEVGFNDAKYFTKRFKKIMGVSPNEYRKLLS
ncbi:response regulator transcription factor [Muricomes intestini]|uniref:response regulator transcription factor n=1 Tax=Muricomes intestini TaxID=1796634 RepID=UPI0014054220|nr:response regulator [Muricomes intestini]